MKVLLDTNIIIHREAERASNVAIGQLFFWLDKLKFVKCIHPITVLELNKYKATEANRVMNIKIESYVQLKHQAIIGDIVGSLSKEIDRNDNDDNDTRLLNELYENRVDLLITEDRKIHHKAEILGIASRVFRIQSFLEKSIDENPELPNYKVLSVKKVDFAEVDLKDSFFDSFRGDYLGFDKWYNSKAESPCYVCYNNNELAAFLFVKIEDETENYSDISPAFSPRKRLKIGTLKVAANGFKIGERFLKIIFDNAHLNKVDEIYVTIFDKRPEQMDLIEMILEWGFVKHGTKETENGVENVYVRTFGKKFPVSIENPKLTFPFISKTSEKYIIPIRPEYHTELFPDSINTREDVRRYIDNEPHRNRISKAYITHVYNVDLKVGDVVLIYRMGEEPPKRFSSTVTTVCIVESVKKEFKNFEDFYACCNRRTMLTKEELEKNWWNLKTNYRPVIINLLFAHSFPTPKPTLNDLIDLKVVQDVNSAPRGVSKISDKQFNDLVRFAYKKKS